MGTLYCNKTLYANGVVGDKGGEEIYSLNAGKKRKTLHIISKLGVKFASDKLEGVSVGTFLTQRDFFVFINPSDKGGVVGLWLSTYSTNPIINGVPSSMDPEQQKLHNYNYCATISLGECGCFVVVNEGGTVRTSDELFTLTKNGWLKTSL